MEYDVFYGVRDSMTYSQRLMVPSETRNIQSGPLAIWLHASFLCLFLSGVSAWAAISIEDVEDTEVYRDRVSFLVRTEAGFDYTAELNGKPIATDVWIEIDPTSQEIIERFGSGPNISFADSLEMLKKAGFSSVDLHTMSGEPFTGGPEPYWLWALARK